MANEAFPPRSHAAVEKGLTWLASHQNDDGSWTCKVGHKLYNQYEGEEGKHVGVTALACMAFLAAGNQPGRGPYGHIVQRGVDFILAAVREEDGYITYDGTRMYSHAFATLFLAECYGMTPQPAVKNALKRAVQLIVNAQNPDGGWRYSPMPIDADISVTVSTLQALRAARNAGLSVPLDTIEKAQAFVRACASNKGASGFHYQKPDASFGDGRPDDRITFALTACGVVSMVSAGEYSAVEGRNAIRALEMFRGDYGRGVHWTSYHYFYSHYYGMQAYRQLASREVWDAYRAEVVGEILEHQRQDGSWEDDVGPTYATAMACLVMQLPCEWLPIFQK
jgi:squalene cyclase